MKVGDLKERIEFYHVPALTANGMDVTGVEVKFFECAAIVKQMQGFSRMIAAQEVLGIPYDIKTRYYPAIENTTAIIKWKGKRLKINGTPVNKDNRELYFQASE